LSVVKKVLKNKKTRGERCFGKRGVSVQGNHPFFHPPVKGAGGEKEGRPRSWERVVYQSYVTMGFGWKGRQVDHIEKSTKLSGRKWVNLTETLQN